MFAPIMILIRKLIGQSEFNHLRSKLIVLHIQAITQVCDRCGIHIKVRQHLIRMARDNGKKLGLLNS
ncbi:electron transporter, partial [Anabaena minutissima FACHB-250]|nr:electron transporter [Anabaena minutissima FACHB-250]